MSKQGCKFQRNKIIEYHVFHKWKFYWWGGVWCSTAWYVWCRVWKPLHVYEGCDIHEEIKLILPNQRWEILHQHTQK